MFDFVYLGRIICNLVKACVWRGWFAMPGVYLTYLCYVVDYHIFSCGTVLRPKFEHGKQTFRLCHASGAYGVQHAGTI